MLKQSLHLKMQQKLSPQQIQLMKLIQLPTLAFEQKVRQEIEDNIVLEAGKEEEHDEEDLYRENEDYPEEISENEHEEEINIDDYIREDEIPDYQVRSDNYSPDDEEKTLPHAAGKSFHQHLIDQLNTYELDDVEYEIAMFLVGSIDEAGYIRQSVEDIVDDLAFTMNIITDEQTVERILKNIIHKMEPTGVGARDLRECLMLQLSKKKTTPVRSLAYKILDEQFDVFVKKHYKKLMNKFDISDEQLKEAISEIEKLNPKPGGSYAGGNTQVEQIIPDFVIRIIDGELELSLNARNVPDMHISPVYLNMLKGYKESKNKTKSQKDATRFIKQKLDAAKWFIDAVKQRQNTLLVTMQSIVNYQKEYFLTGDYTKLRPMILKDIAEDVGLDVSTVSRVANSKYVQTPYGTKLIKEFFSESMKNTKGEDVSTKEIKSILEQVIDEEDKKKPLTDDKLAALLKERGYPIARRTVAKYREQLGIPVARLRKKL